MFQPQLSKFKNLKLIGSVPPEVLKGKRVLVRCDFNVDVSEKGKLLNRLRVESSYRTINYLKNSGARVILISHIGRKKEDTLTPVYNFLKKKYKIDFLKDIMGDNKEFLFNMKEGEIVLFENLRKWNGETKKGIRFIKKLVGMADVFVNEAFPVSHRDHASITGIPPYLTTYIGFQFRDEIENLSKAFDAKHPFLAIIGGAKFKTKLGVIESLEDQADLIFVGGALANDVYKTKGYEMGNSDVSSVSQKVIDKLIASNKIAVPLDVKTVNKIGFERITIPEKIKKGERIIDGGPKTAKFLKDEIKKSKMIIWNGPLGLYEKGYDYLTKKVARDILKSNAYSIVGGGDTVIEITKLKSEKDFNFVSMAGGAMLEFIAKGTLIGIDIIENK